MSLISIKNLNKCYGQGNTIVYALKDVCLDVACGEFTAIVGPSGSGKSTLLHLIGALDKSDSGSILFDGVDLNALNGNALSDFRRDRCGFIFQSFNLIPVLTVKENVEYVMLLQGVSKSERYARVKKVLSELGMADLQDRRPHQLSGGQQQRVAIARAIASEPDLVLADEPTANLDSKTGASLIKMMKTLNLDRGVTFLFSTHDHKIMEMATRLVYLKDGVIEENSVPNS